MTTFGSLTLVNWNWFFFFQKPRKIDNFYPNQVVDWNSTWVDYLPFFKSIFHENRKLRIAIKVSIDQKLHFSVFKTIILIISLFCFLFFIKTVHCVVQWFWYKRKWISRVYILNRTWMNNLNWKVAASYGIESIAYSITYKRNTRFKLTMTQKPFYPKTSYNISL